jgi:hypothetical protein
MDTIVASGKSHANIDWIAFSDSGECDFRDNRVELDSYFDEADMNS